MSRKNIMYLIMVGFFLITACSSKQKIEADDEFAIDSGLDEGKSAKSGLEDELSLDGPTTETTASTSDQLSLEDELNNLDKQPEASPVAVEPEPQPEIPVVQQEPQVDTIVVQDAVINDKPVTINNVAYQANKNGGTIIITADNPPMYTTRLNSTTNQFVVEIQNSTIPKKLKRSLNTKDMESSIGSVDIYQNQGSNTSRFVVQLRAGAAEPVLQVEGNSLLIIGSSLNSGSDFARSSGVGHSNDTGYGSATKDDLKNSNIDGKAFVQDEFADLNSDGIMSSDNLEEFLISNNKFYGKKISIETSKMEIKDVLKFLADESGVNMIIDQGVSGSVSLKLRNVPWDQALILLLKSKQLAFKRQGTVLRIASVDQIKKEEEEAIKLKESRTVVNPQVIVKRFFIGYANVDDIKSKIAEYIGVVEAAATSNSAAARPGATSSLPLTGAQAQTEKRVQSVIADKGTNSIIVTDTEENMQRVEQLILALDTQPQQVLIEGKVVEAKESFTKGLGIQWTSNPTLTNTTNTSRITITPALDAGVAVLNNTFTWGQLDILGSLTARLQIGEREDKVRVLSSPRIAVLSSETATISQTSGLLLNQTQNTNGIISTIQQVVQVGVTLNVTPVVSNEGTVTLKLDIKRDFLPRVDSQAPDVRSANTKVIVKSGQTAVIGGIFESESRDANSGAPGLRDIPVIGRLFKTTQEVKSKNELVMFVTPTILKPIAGSEKRDNSF